MSTETLGSEPTKGDRPLRGLLSVASRTDIGLRREENQDSLGIIDSNNFRLFTVADGMGGVKGGAVASGIAVSALKEKIGNLSLVDQSTIVDAVKTANTRIFQEASSKPAFTGMGTTCVGIAFVGKKLLVFNVGDSRAYRLRKGRIVQLTQDHTLVMELLRSGTITQDQAKNHPVSHMLTRSLGPSPDVEVDCWYAPEDPEQGDKYILCSDGLYNLVGSEDIQKVLESKTIDESVKSLVDLANERGGTDNITVIVVEVGALSSQEGVTLDRPVGETLEVNSGEIEQVPFSSRGSSAAVSPIILNEGKKEEIIEERYDPIDSPVVEASVGLNNVQRDETFDDDEKSNAEKPSVDHIQVPREDRESELGRRSTEAFTFQNESDEAGPPRPGMRGVFLVAGLVALSLIAGALIISHEEETPVSHSGPGVATLDSLLADLERERRSVEFVDRSTKAHGLPLPESTQSTQKQAAVSDKNKSKSKAALSNEQVSRIEKRRDMLHQRVADLTTKIAALEGKTSVSIEGIKEDAGKRKTKAQGDLELLRKDMDVATRRLAIWHERRKQLRETEAVNLAAPVALASEAVRAKHELFKDATTNYIREAEVLILNPADTAQSQKVAELVAIRKRRMAELSDEILTAIENEINNAEQKVAELALQRDSVEILLQGAVRDELYVTVLSSSDAEAKSKMKSEFEHEKEAASGELESLSDILSKPDSVLKSGEANPQLDFGAAG